MYLISAILGSDQEKWEGKIMFKPKGFYTSDGFVGFLPDGSRIIFATYREYMEYIREAAAA